MEEISKKIVKTEKVDDFVRGEAYSPFYFKFIVYYDDESTLELLNPTEEEMAQYIVE